MKKQKTLISLVPDLRFCSDASSRRTRFIAALFRVPALVVIPQSTYAINFVSTAGAAFKRVLQVAVALCTSIVMLPSAAQDAQPELSPREDQQLIEPQISRRDVKVPKIDTEDFELGIYTGWFSIEDFGSDPVYGLSAAYHVTEDIFFEIMGGLSSAQDTNFRRIGLPVFPSEEQNLYFANFSVGANLLPGEFFFGTRKSISAQFYVIGGTGTTRFAGEDHFTFNYGAGFRLLPTDWFAVRMEFRDHVFDSDILGTSKTTHNADVHIGVTVFY